MKVLNCKSCGEEFTHNQSGRGRPPSYCEACKSSGKKVKASVDEGVESFRIVDGLIDVGDRVVFPLKRFFSSLEEAVRYATPVKVLSIDGGVVMVEHPKEKSPLRTNLKNLVKVEVTKHG